MDTDNLCELLERHGVKITPNRLIVAQALASAGRPMSMMELEAEIESIDKSGIFRTLSLFRDSRLVHVLEDSGEGVRYELCRSHHEDEDDDLHVHFYCEECHRTYCLNEVRIPPVEVPEGFEPETVSYLVKGICPSCAGYRR